LITLLSTGYPQGVENSVGYYDHVEKITGIYNVCMICYSIQGDLLITAAAGGEENYA